MRSTVNVNQTQRPQCQAGYNLCGAVILILSAKYQQNVHAVPTYRNTRHFLSVSDIQKLYEIRRI